MIIKLLQNCHRWILFLRLNMVNRIKMMYVYKKYNKYDSKKSFKKAAKNIWIQKVNQIVKSLFSLKKNSKLYFILV